MLKELDDIVVGLYDRAVTFLQDWCFLSQKRVEQIIMALYVVCCIADLYLVLATMHAKHPCGNLGLSSFTNLAVGWVMWREHKEPKAARSVRRLGPLERGFRLAWVALITSIAMLAVSSHFFSGQNTSTGYYFSYSLTGTLWGLFRSAMAYVTVLDVEGEKGRAAAMAWDKVKELFGTSWVVQPQGAKVGLTHKSPW